MFAKGHLLFLRKIPGRMDNHGGDIHPFALEPGDHLAAEQMCKLPGYGKPHSCAAVLSGRTAVRLLKGLEDDSLLTRSDTDAGVLDGDGQALARAKAAFRQIDPRAGRAESHGDASRLRELVGQVQDPVDQIEQISAAAVDDPRGSDLLLGQVAFLVLRQPLRQKQQAVERRHADVPGDGFP